MPVDDPQNFRREKLNQKAKLSELPDEKRQELEDYIQKEENKNQLAEGTLAKRLGKIRTILNESSSTLKQTSASDINNIITQLRRDRDWTAGTARNYQKAIRRYLDTLNQPDKKEKIILTSTDRGRGTDEIDTEELPTEEELRQLVMEKSRNLRDKAMFSFLIESGCRLSASLSLQIKDVKFGEGPAGSTIVIFRNSIGLKGVENHKIPIHYSSQFMRDYLYEEHPDRENPEAPFFAKSKENYREGEDNSLNPPMVRRRLRRITEDTDIDVNPHKLKHVRATNMREQGWPDHLLKHYLGWSENSNQLDRYVHAEKEKLNEQVVEMQGMEPEERERTPKLPRCPSCKSPLSSDYEVKFCPHCKQRIKLYDHPDWLKAYIDVLDNPEDDIAYRYMVANPHLVEDNPDHLRTKLKHTMKVQLAIEKYEKGKEVPEEWKHEVENLAETYALNTQGKPEEIDWKDRYRKDGDINTLRDELEG